MSEFGYNFGYRLYPEDPVTPEVVAPEVRIWEEAVRASEISAQAAAHLDGLYEEIVAKRSRTNYLDRHAATELEKDYWEQEGQLRGLKALEASLLGLLEQFEAGELSSDDLKQHLPTDQEEETISKRRQAIEKARASNKNAALTAMELFMFGYGNFYNRPGLTTDPRRLATGRNLTKLVARKGLNGYDATHRFFEVTADTHGGKSRRPSKSDTHYVSKSGKRIRKF